MTSWANYFFEVPDALAANDEVRETSVELVDSEPIHAKAVEVETAKNNLGKYYVPSLRQI